MKYKEGKRKGEKVFFFIVFSGRLFSGCTVIIVKIYLGRNDFVNKSRASRNFSLLVSKNLAINCRWPHICLSLFNASQSINCCSRICWSIATSRPVARSCKKLSIACSLSLNASTTACIRPRSLASGFVPQIHSSPFLLYFETKISSCSRSFFEFLVFAWFFLSSGWFGSPRWTFVTRLLQRLVEQQERTLAEAQAVATSHFSLRKIDDFLQTQQAPGSQQSDLSLQALPQSTFIRSCKKCCFLLWPIELPFSTIPPKYRPHGTWNTNGKTMRILPTDVANWIDGIGQRRHETIRNLATR